MIGASGLSVARLQGRCREAGMAGVPFWNRTPRFTRFFFEVAPELLYRLALRAALNGQAESLASP